MFPYDTIMIYCPYCAKRSEILVKHPKAQGNHYQQVNVPDHIAKSVTEQTITCDGCKNKLDVDYLHVKTTEYNVRVRINCEGMTSTDDWYEDAIPTDTCDNEYYQEKQY
tara:strand:+ start:318 stop:644 length:327 start_codon:yes stop_codon:yes gene_type:complete